MEAGTLVHVALACAAVFGGLVALAIVVPYLGCVAWRLADAFGVVETPYGGDIPYSEAAVDAGCIVALAAVLGAAVCAIARLIA